MYPTPAPGGDASFVHSSSIWRDIFAMLRQWRNGDFTRRQPLNRRGTVQIKNNTGRNVTAGEFLQIESMTQPSDSSLGIASNYSPVLSAVEPTWHTAIDNIIISDGPVLQDALFPYHPRSFGVVSCTGSIGTGERYVAPDPTNTKFGMRTSSGLFRVLGYDSTNDFAIVSLQQSQDRWRYKLTETSNAPGTTEAELYSLDGVKFADSIDLTDPLSIGGDDDIDYEGYCVLVGNEFHIAPGPC